jgi:hypothetical protein
MNDLYDDDILTWSEQQASLLRRLAGGERVNDQVDWENVTEEIESVGRSEFRACESLLIQALRHRLKLMAWPNALAGQHWEDELAVFQVDASLAFQESMRQRLDMNRIYRLARHRFPQQIDGVPQSAPLPDACPFTLDELLAEA